MTYRFLSVLMLLLSLSPAFSQNGRTRALEEYPAFKNDSLLVVLYPGQEAYNQVVQETFERYWKFMPYRFLPVEKLPDYASNERYSMLVRNDAERFVGRVTGTDRIRSNHLAIYPCGLGADLSNYNGARAITQYHFSDINDTSAYLFKLPALIQSMQHYLYFVEENKPTEDTHEKLLAEFCNAEAAALAKRTLYLLPEQLPDNLATQEMLDKYYIHDAELTDKATIAQAISAQRADVAFLHIDPNKSNLYVLGADGGKILYWSTTSSYGEVRNKDLKRLSKAVQ